MFQRIIVAFDGSTLAREGVAYAEMLCQRLDASMLAAHLIEPTPPVVVADPMAGFDPGPALAATADADRAERKAEREHFERELADLKSYSEEQGVACETRIDDDHVVPWLLRNAGEGDCIVVGAKGRFSDAGIGSATKRLVTRAPCPVLVVAGDLKPINRVLAVYDASQPSERAGFVARDLSRRLGWPLTILAIPKHGASLDDALEWAQMIDPEAQVVNFGHLEAGESEQIEQAAAHARQALLVMGAYPDSFFHSLLFGSTTGRVIHNAESPVLLVN